MNLLNSVQKSFRMRQILINFLIGITLSIGIGFVQDIHAIASPKPIATYQSDADTVSTNKTLPSQYLDEDLAANAQKNLKKNTDAVKDKLNFDNTTPAETKAKEFVDNAKERAEQIGKTAQRSFGNFSHKDK